MQRIGIGMVFVGASIWIATGVFVFMAPSSQKMAAARPVAAAAEEAASASIFYDGSVNAPDGKGTLILSEAKSNSALQGPYYNYTPQAPSHDTTPLDAPDTSGVAQPKSWYMRLFGGFGAMFQRIVPGQTDHVWGIMTPPTQFKRSATAPLPMCVITINPNSVPYYGSATITWTSHDAEHAIFQGLGEIASNGSLPVNHLTSTRAFAIAVQGAGGSSSCYTVVNVGAHIVGPVTCLISSNPAVITKGKSANLSWGSKNTVFARISNLGAVATIGGSVVSPQKTTTYTLTVGGESGEPLTCDTTVTVL